jgi:uncharacterized protein YjiS (DUF1127 family)
MTDTTMTLARQRGLARRLQLWLASRRRTPVLDLGTLSDHMRRDIGVPRGAIGQMWFRTRHDAIRHTG